MKTIKKLSNNIALTLILIATASTSIACSFPGFSAKYQLQGKQNKPMGILTRTLTLSKNHYKFTSTSNVHVKIFFHTFKDSMAYFSSGQYLPSRFIPTSSQFTESRKHTSLTVPFTHGSHQLDAASYVLQMRQDLLNKASNFKYTVYDSKTKKWVIYQFHKGRQQQLKTPMGNLTVIPMTRRGSSGLTIVLKFAPRKNYLLAQSLQLKNNQVVFSSTLTGYQPSKNSAYCAVK